MVEPEAEMSAGLSPFAVGIFRLTDRFRHLFIDGF